MNWSAFTFILWVIACSAEVCPQYPSPVPLWPENPILSGAFSQVDQLLQNFYEQQSLPGLVCTAVYDQVRYNHFCLSYYYLGYFLERRIWKTESFQRIISSSNYRFSVRNR